MTNHLGILLITGALLLLACPDSTDEVDWIDPSIYTIGVMIEGNPSLLWMPTVQTVPGWSMEHLR